MSFPVRASVCRMAVVVICLGTVASTARAVDNYVDCQNGNDAGAGTVADPWKTIQVAVDRSNAGDRVRIVAGTCPASEQLYPVDVKPGVSIVGDGSDATVIDNTGSGSGAAAFSLADVQDFPPSQRLTDMWIETETEGIALQNGSPTIANNVITGGGTIGVAVTAYYGAASPTIEDNVFMDVLDGVSISADRDDASPTIRRNWFLGDVNLGFQPEAGVRGVLGSVTYTMAPMLENNVVTSSRVGMSFLGGSPTINNNTISATETAVVFYGGTPPSLSNNIIAYNSYGVSEASEDATPGAIDNNDFFANAAGDYFDYVLGPQFDVNALPAASGNVAVAPLFVNPGGADFHISETSLARDAGLPAQAPPDDIDRDARSDGMPDIGADETGDVVISSSELVVTAWEVATDVCPGGPSPPDGDGDLDPGESVDLTLWATNYSGWDLTEVTATITPSGPDLTPASQTIVFGDVPRVSVVAGATPFTFRWDPPGLACADDVRFQIEFASAETGPLGANTLVVPVGTTSCEPCSSPDLPSVELAGDALFDTCANGSPPGGNAELEPGEAGEIQLTISNGAPVARASYVTASFSTANPAITPSSGTVVLGNADPGMTIGAEAFAFQASSSLACGADVVFDVAIDWLENDGNPPLMRQVTLAVPSGCLDCAAVQPAFEIDLGMFPDFTDSCVQGSPAAGDGQIDPGETIDLRLWIRNSTTNVGATNVTGTVYARTANVLPESDAVSFGDVGPGASVAAMTTIPIRTDAVAIGCGDRLDFELELSSEQTGPLPLLPFSLVVANPCTACGDTLPSLQLAQTDLTDICEASEPPGGNDEIDAGETVELVFTVNNASDHTARDVEVDVSMVAPWVRPSSGTVAIGDVPSRSAGSSPPFRFQVAGGFDLCLESFDVDVTIRSPDTPSAAPVARSYTVQCDTCPVPMPDPSYTGHTTSDICPFAVPPSGDGQVDPGELVTITIDVVNLTPNTATGVRATIMAASGGISPAVGSVAGPDLPPFGSDTLPPYSFALDGVVFTCGSDVELDVYVSSNETGPQAPSRVVIPISAACNPCRQAVGGLMLYRSTVPALGAGWKAAVPLPLLSTSTIDTPAFPIPVNSPGSNDDVGAQSIAEPLVLYRVLDAADGDVGNVLRVAKVSGTSDIRLEF